MAGWFPLFSTSSFNGGKSQVNFNFLQGGGEFPYLNRLKCGQAWSFLSSNATIPKTPDYFDTNGYPLSIVNGGVTTVCPIEDDASTNIVILWDGWGTLGFGSATSGTLTLANGSLDNSVSHAAGRAEFSVSGSVTILTVNITATNAGNRVTNIRVCRAGAEETLLVGGAVYGVKFKQRLAQAKFGVMRFFNWVQVNQTNVGLWSHRKPSGYYMYSSSEWRTEYLCNSAGHGVTTNSGADYSVSAPSTWSGLTDKAIAHAVYNASSPTSATVTFSNASTNLNWPLHGLAIGNQVYFSDGTVPANVTANGLSFPFTSKYFVKTVVDTNNITISATNGGTAITFSGTASCTGRTIVTLNIGATGAIPVLSSLCSPMTASGGTFPIGGSENSLATFFYDSNLAAYISTGGNSNGPGGIANGAPPETFVQLSKDTGAHPWLSIPAMACTPMGATTAVDYTTQLATYMQANLPSWAVPRFEVANELFNLSAGFISRKYAEAVATSYGWGADKNNWAGRANSTVGQAINAVYGGTPNSGTKYVMICGVQTGTGNSPSDCTASNPILDSTLYKIQSPQSGYTASAASGWATAVAPSNYFAPANYGRNQELQDAFNWNSAIGAPAKAVVAASYVDTLTQGFLVTVTNGTPGTVNKVAHGMAVGQIGQFMLEGTANTGVNSSANLWVGTVPDADHFTISSTDPNTAGVTGVVFSGSGSGNIWWIPNGNATLPQLAVRYKNWKGWASGFSVNFMEMYEGGYSPDLDTSNICFANITAMTRGASTVITAPTSFIQGVRSPDNANAFNPAAVVGMYIQLDSLPTTNGWDAYNYVTSGTGYQVTAVSGASITIALDSSARAGNVSGLAAFGTYADSGANSSLNQTGIYAPIKWLNGLRAAGKNVASLQTHLTTDYNNVVAAGGRNPSMFQLGGTSNVWSVLDPDIFVTPNPPQWLAAIAFNA